MYKCNCFNMSILNLKKLTASTLQCNKKIEYSRMGNIYNSIHMAKKTLYAALCTEPTEAVNKLQEPGEKDIC